MTIAQPIQKCRCASKTHEHKPGKCTNLPTKPESLCKSCYEKTSAELKARSRLVGRQRKERVKTSGLVRGGYSNASIILVDVHARSLNFQRAVKRMPQYSNGFPTSSAQRLLGIHKQSEAANP